MSRNRIRPTFLLHCIVFTVVLGVGLGAFAIAQAIGDGILLLLTLGIGAALLLLSNLITEGVVWVMTWRTDPEIAQSSPLWFYDTGEADRKEAEQFRHDTSDNPTLR